MTRVGVVLSSFERARGLLRAGRSLQAQRFTDWRCVIADDHSSDERVGDVMAELELDERFTELVGHRRYSTAQKNTVCSFSAHINAALRELSGVDYICYLLDDVEYHPDRIAEHVAFLDRHPDVFLVWGEQWLVEYRANGSVRRERKQIPNPRDNYRGMSMRVIRTRLATQNILNHCSATHRTQPVYQWSEKGHHWTNIDQVLWRLMAAEQKFAHVPVVGETMHSTPDDIGPMMVLKGKTIADVARERIKKAREQ